MLEKTPFSRRPAAGYSRADLAGGSLLSAPGYPGGHCRALIENYRDIVEFSPEKIRLSSHQGEIVLAGAEMCLAQVRPECLMVVGRIDSVSMPEGGAVHG